MTSQSVSISHLLNGLPETVEVVLDETLPFKHIVS